MFFPSFIAMSGGVLLTKYLSTLLCGRGAVWAASAGFAITADEAKAIAGLYASPGKAFSDGIRVEGKKHLAVKADERSIYGKLGAGGVVVVKTKQALIIALYGEGHQPGAAANAVEKIGDYLIENGY